MPQVGRKRLTTWPGWRLSFDGLTADDIPLLEKGKNLRIVSLCVSGPISVPLDQVVRGLALSELNLDSAIISDPNLSAAVSQSCLQCLSIRNMDLTGLHFRDFSERLSVLDLSGCRLEFAAMNGLAHMSQLDELTLFLAQFQGKPDSELSINLHQLRIIDFSGSNLDDKMLLKINFGENCEFISVMFTEVTDEAAQMLSRSIGGRVEVWGTSSNVRTVHRISEIERKDGSGESDAEK